MNDVAMALLSAEIKQLVALGGLGIVLVVGLIAASLFFNTRTFGSTQQQNFKFQGQLLELYAANNTILTQQGELLARHGDMLREQQAVAAQQTDVQRLIAERIEQQNARIDEDLSATRALAETQREMLPQLVTQFAEQIKLEVIPAIIDQFDAQQRRSDTLVQQLRERLNEIGGRLDSLREQIEAGNSLADKHHQSILDICAKLLELIDEETQNEQRGRDDVGSNHNDRASGSERGVGVFEPAAG